MVGTLTYTGVHGPAQALTAQVFNDVSKLEFDLRAEVLRVTYGQPDKTAHLDLKATATQSAVIVAGVSIAFTASS